MKEGLVIRTTGSWYKVLADSESVDCRLRGNYRLRGSRQTNPVAVGDRVLFELQDDGTGIIHDILDRKNYIVRRSVNLSKQTHVIAANIDLLCVVATLGLPRTSTGFIDRLLVTAEAYHIPACLVFNKVDLYDDELWGAHNELKAIYQAAGYPVLEVSALTGDGLESLKGMIAGRTVLFSGHSGVGKSALLNALCPGLDLRTGDLSDWSLKGRHTTTFAEIFPVELSGQWPVASDQSVAQSDERARQLDTDHWPVASDQSVAQSDERASQLDSGQWPVASDQSVAQSDERASQLDTDHWPLVTYLIDTPGIKEFGMVDFTAQELSHFFPEMRALLSGCHFANCTHRHEPQCAVRQAVDEGRISDERYQNYLNILADTVG